MSNDIHALSDFSSKILYNVPINAYEITTCLHLMVIRTNSNNQVNWIETLD